ncbi:hypothetical protein GLE_5458 [Lysobacter enzymogenes]|uniref:Uncharacterized protein n=1 Tax=Lysobacter enzymogenes TaxID=69 RepID=A0A0S2DR50_LYSEN|nr:hypothetical protein GLE_5458 [Lysobacter enzymogenes]
MVAACAAPTGASDGSCASVGATRVATAKPQQRRRFRRRRDAAVAVRAIAAKAASGAAYWIRRSIDDLNSNRPLNSTLCVWGNTGRARFM